MPAQSLPTDAVPRMPVSAVSRLTPQPLPDQPATFLVCGVLAEDARVYVQPSGHVLLQVLVLQRLERNPQACPVLATRRMPDGCSAAAQMSARHLAQGLRRGCQATVYGRSMAAGQHRGQTMLLLTDVLSITNSGGAMSIASKFY